MKIIIPTMQENQTPQNQLSPDGAAAPQQQPQPQVDGAAAAEPPVVEPKEEFIDPNEAVEAFIENLALQHKAIEKLAKLPGYESLFQVTATLNNIEGTLVTVHANAKRKK